MPNSNQELQLLSIFIRALSHQVRTPLSVISNNLHYLKNQGASQECTESLTKCNQISTFLRESVELCSQKEESLENVSVEQYFKKAGFSPQGQDFLAEITNPYFKSALDLLYAILSDLKIISNTTHCEIDLENQRVSVPLLSGENLNEERIHSFCELLHIQRGIDDSRIPVLDALLIAAGVSVEVCAGSVLLCF